MLKGSANTVDLFTLVTQTALRCDAPVHVRTLVGNADEGCTGVKRRLGCLERVALSIVHHKRGLSDESRAAQSMDVGQATRAASRAKRVRVRIRVGRYEPCGWNEGRSHAREDPSAPKQSGSHGRMHGKDRSKKDRNWAPRAEWL